jgi:hypothetical protein
VGSVLLSELQCGLPVSGLGHYLKVAFKLKERGQGSAD